MTTQQGDFVAWLEDELRKRGWKPADLVRAGNIHSGLLSKILNHERKPGIRSLQAIATGLRLPPEEVFRRAGLISAPPPQSRVAKEIAELIPLLSDRDLELVLRMVHAMVRAPRTSEEENPSANSDVA